MPNVCLYFQVHQPMRLKKYRFFDIGVDDNYFDDVSDSQKRNNKKVMEKVAGKAYLPTNALLLELLNKHPEFNLSFSLTGVFLEACQNYAPEVIKSFQRLTETGRVELLAETYHHSLAFLHSKSEFRKQIQLHKKILKELFGASPKVFRNTELIFNNELGWEVEGLGFDGVLAEGADQILNWRSPNFVYRPKGCKKLKVLLKNYRLSDDIAFRFSEKSWSEYPLTAEKYAGWISAINDGDLVNLFMDYETFGEHQWEDSGIFEFLKLLPGELLKSGNGFVTVSEALKYEPIGELDIPNFTSWADLERDLSAWTGNPMQKDALKKLFELEESVLKLDNQKLIDSWRKLTTSDHFYYMCTKWFADGDVHKYFNPHESPYEAFITFMNVLTDLKLRVENQSAAREAKRKED